MGQWFRKSHFNWVLAFVSFLMGKEDGVRVNEGMGKREGAEGPSSQILLGSSNNLIMCTEQEGYLERNQSQTQRNTSCGWDGCEEHLRHETLKSNLPAWTQSAARNN